MLSNTFDPNQIKAIWDDVSNNIDLILKNKPCTSNFETNYSYVFTILFKCCRNIYKLVQNHKAKFVYDQTTEKLKHFMHLQSVHVDTEIKKDRNVLDVIEECWRDVASITDTLSDLFLYLERNYCQGRIPKIHTLAMNMFGEDVLKPACDEVVSEIRSRLKSERQGEIVNTSQLKSISQMLCVHGTAFFEQMIEQEYLKSLKEVLITEAASASSLSLKLYLDRLDEARSRELRRVDSFLIPSTIHKVEQVFNEVWLEAFAPKILAFCSANEDMTKTASPSVWRLFDACDTEGLVRLVRYYARKPQTLLRALERSFAFWLESTVSLAASSVSENTPSNTELSKSDIKKEEANNEDFEDPIKENTTSSATTVVHKTKAPAINTYSGFSMIEQCILIFNKATSLVKDALSHGALQRAGGTNLRPEASDFYLRNSSNITSKFAMQRCVMARKKAVEYAQTSLRFGVAVNAESSVAIAFKKGLNSLNGSLVAESLCDFIDRVIADVRLSEEEVEARLADVVILFKFLNDRDVFELRFRTKLAKRLLRTRSISHGDKSLISRLKTECGAHFAHKLSAMIADAATGSEIISDFKSKMEGYANNQNTVITTQKQVLSSNSTNNANSSLMNLNWNLWGISTESDRREFANLVDCFDPLVITITHWPSTVISGVGSSQTVAVSRHPAALAASQGSDRNTDTTERVSNEAVDDSQASGVIILPGLMNGVLRAFEKYYSNRFTSKRLSWLHNEGGIQLRGRWENISTDLASNSGTRNYLFNLPSPLCAAILYLFNNKEPGRFLLKWKEIFASLIPSSVKTSSSGNCELIADISKYSVESGWIFDAVYTLCANKILKIEKCPDSKQQQQTSSIIQFALNDAFFINEEFKHPSRVINVKSAKPKNKLEKEKNAEIEQANTAVIQNRRFIIEAVIVRIMKARRTLSHRLLESEVVKQVGSAPAGGFELEPRQLKMVVESLIERDFLERDVNDHQTYRYVA